MKHRRIISALAVGLFAFIAAAGHGDEFAGGNPVPRIVRLPRKDAVPLPERIRAMELGEFEEIARQCNPTLIQAGARVQAARAEWEQVGLYPNPHIGYESHEMNDMGQAGQQGAAFSQEIVTAGKRRRGRDVAACALRQAEHVWSAQHCRVINDVRHAFYEVMAAQLTIELAERLVGIGQEGVRSAEQLFEAQEVSRVDVLQARIEADSARILSEKARNRHKAAWRNLAVVVGTPDIRPIQLSGEIQKGIERLAWEMSIQHVLGNSPVLAEARAGVSRAQARVDQELAERIPNLDIQGGVLYDNATRDTIAEAGVGFTVPLFNRNQGNIRKAEVELTAARGEVRRVALELQQRLAVEFERYENARFQVDKYSREILPNARKTLDLVTIGYRQGEFDYVTLLTAQRTFFQVNMDYVDSLSELRAAAVSIDGYLLSDSLQQR